MGHSHGVLDKDTHFIIDPVTRAITTSSEKLHVMQYDHNSETLTFEMPRYIEGHDMSLCNRVEAHFLNIDNKTKDQISGHRELEDFRVSEDDENKVVVSWTITKGSTKLGGKLNFLLNFRCVENGVETYAWHTDFFTNYNVKGGLDAAALFEDEYVDVIEQWKASVMQHFTDDLAAWKEEKAEELSKNIDDTFNAHRAAWNNALEVERKRINNIVALKDGSTTGDAELQDVRIDYEGYNHESAGAAVRYQANKLAKRLDISTGAFVVKPSFAFGYRWIDESGGVHEDQNYAVTRIVDLTDCTAIKFRLYQYNDDASEKHLGMIAYYDQNLNHIKSITEIAAENGIVEAVVIPPEEAKFAIASLYKPIGNGYIEFYYSVNTIAGKNTVEKIIDLCECPTETGYIRTDGVVIDDVNWVHTGFIAVKKGENLELSMHGHKAVNSISYYDETKTLISGVVADIEYIVGTTEKFKFGIETIPEGVAFVRLCYRINADTVSKCKYTVNTVENNAALKEYAKAIEKLALQIGSISIDTEKMLLGKTVFLAGDSRSSTDYSFYGETMQEKTGADVIVGGASGWKTGAIASNSYFERLINNEHDFSLWLVGGNDTGEKGTVGTFKSTSENGVNGENVVEETDISKDYSGTTFVQAVDHIMRKYKALFYNWKTLNNGHKPKMIFCTDIPQKRSGGSTTWSLKENWERKRNAILECCEKNNVACLDLYKLCNFDMSFEPEWTSQTDKVNNNGLYFMDGLHPNKYGIDIITSLEIEEIRKYLIIH